MKSADRPLPTSKELAAKLKTSFRAPGTRITLPDTTDSWREGLADMGFDGWRESIERYRDYARRMEKTIYETIPSGLTSADEEYRELYENEECKTEIVDCQSLDLIRNLEPTVQHLTAGQLTPTAKKHTYHTNFQLLEIFPEAGYDEAKKEKCRSVNKDLKEIAAEVHYHQGKHPNFAGKCGKRPENPEQIGVKVQIGKEAFYVCQFRNPKCRYLTFYHADDVRRWKWIPAKEIVEDDARLQFYNDWNASTLIPANRIK